MPDNSLADAPNKIQELLARAKGGAISPLDFCRELYTSGIKGQVARMRYLRDVFGLTASKAKQIVIETDHGSITALEKEIKRSES